MKIQNLAIIFIVIIFPISMVISTYTKYQVNTIRLQNSYDSKLQNATYDAIKAYQLNASASGSSDITNSKLRDIEASAKTFFNSVASNFNMTGYGQDVLKEYVPTIVYTMYDGMYLYTSYKNYLNSGGQNEPRLDNNEAGIYVPGDSTYYNTQNMYGLRPYVFYSCRYKKGSDVDVVITYSLDNYIVIQGEAKSAETGKIEPINLQGYLLKNVEIPDENSARYRGIKIEAENNIIYENIYDPNDASETRWAYPTRKIDGIKYYNDGTNNFSFLNNEYLKQNNGLDVKNNTNAVQYYKQAQELKDAIENYGLSDLTRENALDKEGKAFDKWVGKNEKIFSGLYKSDPEIDIEEPSSIFNQHRLEVIRDTIEDNLKMAIANYTSTLNATHKEFKMPQLSEEDWDKVLNNITCISFLQGVSIGGKVYNGYSIVPNTENEDLVSDTSIYIIGDDNQYHFITDKYLISNPPTDGNTARGVLNSDLQRHSIIVDGGTSEKWYIPKGDFDGASVPSTLSFNGKPSVSEYASYGSITTSSSNNTMEIDSVNNYLDNLQYDGIDQYSKRMPSDELKKIYYTALARERYGMYRGSRFTIEDLQKTSTVPSGGVMIPGGSPITAPEDVPAASSTASRIYTSSRLLE